MQGVCFYMLAALLLLRSVQITAGDYSIGRRYRRGAASGPSLYGKVASTTTTTRKPITPPTYPSTKAGTSSSKPEHQENVTTYTTYPEYTTTEVQNSSPDERTFTNYQLSLTPNPADQHMEEQLQLLRNLTVSMAVTGNRLAALLPQPTTTTDSPESSTGQDIYSSSAIAITVPGLIDASGNSTTETPTLAKPQGNSTGNTVIETTTSARNPPPKYQFDISMATFQDVL